MTAQFTPGPWIADEAEGIWGVFEDRDGSPIAMLEENLEPLKPEHDEANARLIAAAPELYEAVKWSLTHQDECLGDHPDQLNAFEQLLAKARGDDA